MYECKSPPKRPSVAVGNAKAQELLRWLSYRGRTFACSPEFANLKAVLRVCVFMVCGTHVLGQTPGQLAAIEKARSATTTRE